MNRTTLHLGNLAFCQDLYNKGGWKIPEGDFPLCWAQMGACSREETGRGEEVGRLIGKALRSLVRERGLLLRGSPSLLG